MTTELKKRTPRREHLRLLAGVSLIPVVGCGDDDMRGDASDATMDSSVADGSLPDGSVADAELDGATERDAASDASVGWAQGGTKSMTDKSRYPNPFGDVLNACVLVEASTAGPCTTATDLDREDISESWTGLPMRLALKVVDTDCNPVAGVVVNIWHTNLEGSYSGQTPSNGFCLLDQNYASENFFRGARTTDAQGEVYFDSCYPGWYPGRAIHIHFEVKSGDTSYRVSQLYFSPELTQDIFSNHPEYQAFGQPDTPRNSDGIANALSGDELARLTLDTTRMSDGAMLASKVLVV